MERKIEFINLINMLREIDLQKNSIETIKDVLDYIAQELDKYIDDIKEEN